MIELVQAAAVLDIDGSETLELLNFVVAAFAIALLALSVMAYRKTRLRRLVFITAAFGLFALEVVIRQADESIFSIGLQTDQIIGAALDVVILVLFFLAVVVKN